MREICLIPTYRRNHFLYPCLRRIREQDANMDIAVFSDRGEVNLELRNICRQFNASLRVMPIHEYYGNSFCVMEAYRFAYEMGYEMVHVLEDDVMAKPDCLSWHRRTHELFPDIFAACGWVFNLHAPISDDYMFAQWYYAPNASFKRDKLRLIVQHANPRYYNDMQNYIVKTFPNPILHKRDVNTGFHEQDAAIQHVLMQDGTQVAWNGIAKVDHVGTFGYNKPDGLKFTGPLAKCVEEVEALIADEYLRASIFSRAVVEREVGHVIPKRIFTYKIDLPGGWSGQVKSELKKELLPKRLLSVNLPHEATIEMVASEHSLT